MPQPLPSTDPELQELRHRYNRLYARFTEVVDTDPALVARAVQELQELSDRIVALEAPTAATPSGPWPTDPAGPGRLPGNDEAARAEAAPRLPEPGKPIGGIVALRARQTASTDRAGESHATAVPLAPTLPDLDGLHAAIGRQEVRIATLLRKCDEHRQQLAAMEQRIIDQHSVKSLIPQIEALALALDQQQQRITGLAMVLQRLLQWLAAERNRSEG